MTSLQTMYPGVANSPETFLKEALTIDGTIMYLADGSVLGEIPTLAVIGDGQQAETVLVTSKRSDGGYTIRRGEEGPKKAWTKATTVARNWTNKDYETLRANVTAINDDKVDKIDGKGLSTNDYDDAAKAKVDAIPPDPKYTDTVPDLSSYATKEENESFNEDVVREINKINNELKTQVSFINEDIKATAEFLQEDCVAKIGRAKDTLTVDIEEKLDKTDIVNDLTTGGTDRALSAEQGKTLEWSKLNKTDIVNDLTTGGVDKALSAEQGKTLFTYADNGKKSIADAIVGKGVDATKSDDFNTLADKISKIKTGYGVGDVLPEESVEVEKTFVQGQPTKVWEFTEHNSWIRALAVGPDGSIYCGGDKKSVFKISPNGQKVWEFTGHTDSVYALAVGPDGSIYSGGDDKKVFKISPNGQKIWEFTGHTDDVCALAVGSDGSIYSGGADRKVFKISQNGQKIWEFTEHNSWIRALAVGPDGSIYCGGDKKSVFKISPSGRKVWEFIEPENTIYALAVGPDGSIYCCGEFHEIFKISPGGREIRRRTIINRYSIWAVTVGHDGSIYVGTLDGKVYKLYADLLKIWEFEWHSDTVQAVGVGPDGSIYSGGNDNKVIKISDGTYKTSYKIIK